MMNEKSDKKSKIRIYKQIARFHFSDLSKSLKQSICRAIAAYVEHGEPKFEFQTVSWILKISKTLQLQELEEECLKYIEDLCALNCPLCIYVASCKYGHEEMKEIALKHIRKNFKKLCLTDNFVKLEPSHLVKILGDNYLHIERWSDDSPPAFSGQVITRIVKSAKLKKRTLQMQLSDLTPLLNLYDLKPSNRELDVFIAALRWLKADWFDRYLITPFIMKYVRFQLMSEEELVKLNREVEFEAIFRFRETFQMLQDALTYISKTNFDMNAEHRPLPPMPRHYRPLKRNRICSVHVIHIK